MLDLIEKPVTIRNYSIYDVHDLPKLFLGHKVKNKFDEQRLKIKSKYSPKFISHFRMGVELEPLFFYGMNIKPKAIYKDLLDKLNHNCFSCNDRNKFVGEYVEILRDFDLTCDTCYSYWRKDNCPF